MVIVITDPHQVFLEFPPGFCICVCCLANAFRSVDHGVGSRSVRVSSAIFSTSPPSPTFISYPFLLRCSLLQYPLCMDSGKLLRFLLTVTLP